MTSYQLSSGDLTADRRAHYARLYAESGDLAAAVDLQTQALELAPLWAAGWHQLGGYLEKTGDHAGAADAWRKVLTLSPTDIFGASLKLSLTGQAETPSTPPKEYVEALFDGYSDRFDTALLEDLGYCVPERLTALLGEAAGKETQFARVIDLGCGTGLFGERIRRMTSWLEGYDLSQGMLAKAGEKGLYDRLGHADILNGIAAARLPGAEPAELVAAADVFAYFGDLAPVIQVAANLVAAGGLMAFSLEAARRTATGCCSLRCATATAKPICGACSSSTASTRFDCPGNRSGGTAQTLFRVSWLSRASGRAWWRQSRKRPTCPLTCRVLRSTDSTGHGNLRGQPRTKPSAMARRARWNRRTVPGPDAGACSRADRHDPSWTGRGAALD
jgi:predicted TPR repeat methyltransferase